MSICDPKFPEAEITPRPFEETKSNMNLNAPVS